MPNADELMKMADEAIHAYAAWLAESITINEPGNHPDILRRLNEKKDEARRKLEAAIRATCGVPEVRRASHDEVVAALQRHGLMVTKTSLEDMEGALNGFLADRAAGVKEVSK